MTKKFVHFHTADNGEHCVILSRCNWIYPNSREDDDEPVERDEKRYAAIEYMDGDIVLRFPPDCWRDAQHAKTMLEWEDES